MLVTQMLARREAAAGEQDRDVALFKSTRTQSSEEVDQSQALCDNQARNAGVESCGGACLCACVSAAKATFPLKVTYMT